MKKSLKAMVGGFLLFDVNGRRFFRFERAAEEAHDLCRMRLAVIFRGWSLWLWLFRVNDGWSTFLVREHPGPAIYDLSSGRWLEENGVG